MQAATPISLALQAGSSIAGGMSARAKAKGEQQRAENNAFIGRTRAIQTANADRESLADEMASMRAVMATNGQRMNVGAYEMVRELRARRLRDRRVAVGNEMMGVYDAQIDARNAKAEGRAAMSMGLLGAAQPTMDLYQYWRKGRG